MNRTLFIPIFALAVLLTACTKEKKVTPIKENKVEIYPGKWTAAPYSPLQGSEFSLSISYNNKGYRIGGGGIIAVAKVFEYDPAADKWTEKATYPGRVYEAATGFALNGKFYVGTGFNSFPTEGEVLESNEFYEYDPATDKWTRKADFPGSPRAGAVGFAVGDAGYIGLGGAYNFGAKYFDIYKYNPSTDKWTQIKNYPGRATFRNISFTGGDKAYVGWGIVSSFIPPNDLWAYEPATDTWSEKSSYAGGGYGVAETFTINNKPYFVPYTSAEMPASGVWTFDVTADKWSRVADMPGAIHECAASFSINNAGYIFTGYVEGQQTLFKFEP